MAKEIVLISPPTYTHRTPEESLGLEYLTAESEKNGHKVHLVDAWINNLSMQECVTLILSYHPEIIGIAPSMDSIRNSIELINHVRSQGYDKQIIMGGIYASFEASKLVLSMPTLLDGVIIGEADDTFQEFLDSGKLEGISGAVYPKNGDVFHEPFIKQDVDLNALPFPMRASISSVKKLHVPSHVMGSKGCYGNCSFCSVACYQRSYSEKKWRGRDPENIVAEMTELAGLGETMVKFVDDNFFGPQDRRREQRFVELLDKSGIKLRFRLSLRPNDVDDMMIQAMKNVGLFAVSLGVESFVPRKLRDFQKGITVEQNFQALKILKKHGILVQMGHIMFDPFITVAEIEEELSGLEETQWTVTKGICTQLFAAEGSRITDTIKDKVGVTGKEETNYTYQIVDPQARAFHQALQIWARANSRLYDQTIDPISAPKNIPPSELNQFHELCINLKQLDILVARHLLVESKRVPENQDLNSIAEKALLEFEPILSLIHLKITELYDKLDLNYNCSGNKRI